jgi:oxazoline/thiazoline synthase
MVFSPRIKTCFQYAIIPSEGIILLSERRQFLLRGDVYIQLVPLLDGHNTIEDIFARLQDRVPAEELFQALALLRTRELVVDTPSSLPSEQTSFWELMSVDVAETNSRFQNLRVSIASFGAIDTAPFHSLLASLGVCVGDNGHYWIVLTDDYLHNDLIAFNQEALARHRPWLLVKPTGSEILLGPLFLPGKTGCWECLAHRFRSAQKITNYLQEKIGASAPRPHPLPSLPSTFQTALSIAATEVAKWVACGQNENLEGTIVTFDVLSLTTQSHPLVQRPQCPCCGNPHALAAQQSAPVILQSRRKVSSEESSHDLLPEALVKKLEHHISPLTGIVHTLRPASTWTGDNCLTPSYVTGHNFTYVSRDDDLNLDFLHADLQGGSSGKGKSRMRAKASALCESIERYSGVFQGDEARFRAKFKDFGATALHPNAYMFFSEWQFKNREQVNADGFPSTWVPEPFDVDREIEWSPAWSLTCDQPRYVPTAYCYYGYSRQYNTWYARADANGCAAGQSKEEAIFQGIMELVERDSVALWWYNRLKKPMVDLSSFAEPYFQQLQAYYRTLHRDLWVLDVSSDFDVVAFVAVSRRHDQKVEGIMLGFGAHLDPHIAILRALTEMNLQLPLLLPAKPPCDTGALFVNPRVLSWWETARLEDHPHLAPEETAAPKRQVDYQKHGSDDFCVDVMTWVRQAEEKGLETLVVDQTRPDTGLPVVKVIVPGLRHFWPRFAPGRLYDIPVQQGWRTERLTEDQLNPQPPYLSFQS